LPAAPDFPEYLFSRVNASHTSTSLSNELGRHIPILHYCDEVTAKSKEPIEKGTLSFPLGQDAGSSFLYWNWGSAVVKL
ncbi:hypothetical protein, partial [Streptomyces sp. URMC 124]|uniref:hypothetical protein n=1 Tax=Streptomyces sp. URMC 124 TaxID=3423405 RepID=UPI003F52AEFD